jgi:hypothetical protein
MYIGITDVLFHVARIRNVGSLFTEVDILRKNQHISSCVSGSKTGVIEAIYISNQEIYKSLKGPVQRISPKLKTQYQDLFGVPLLKDFKGCDLEETLRLASKKYNRKFVICIKEHSSKFEYLKKIGPEN